MTVYGEEFKYIPFLYGMWDSNIAPVRDGFVRKATNMIPSATGFLQVRGDIVSSATDIPDGGPYNNFNSSAYVSPTDDFPNTVLTAPNQFINYTPSSDGELALINAAGKFFPKKSSIGGNVAYTPVGGFTAVIVYRDRAYDAVNRYTGWNFTTGAAVTTFALPSPPAVGGPTFFFKDRLFSIGLSPTFQSRVGFTDVIAVGGYPETWNSASNFFDLPTTGQTLITGYAILNNIIYFFTEEGIYSLQVAGPPTNWLLKKINEEISVKQSASNNGLVYLLDKQGGVHMFNGYALQKISDPVEEMINEYHGYSLVAFDSGVMLNLMTWYSYLAATVPNRYRFRPLGSKNLFFNGLGWSEFQIGDGTKIHAIQNTVVDKSWHQFDTPHTLFSYVEDNGTSCTVKTARYYPNRHGTESIETAIVHDHVGNQPHKENRFKYGYYDVQAQIPEIITASSVNGAAYGSEDTTSVNAVADDIVFPKVSMPQYARRLKTRIRSTVPVATYAGNPYQVRGMGLVFNTARNRSDQADG